MKTAARELSRLPVAERERHYRFHSAFELPCGCVVDVTEHRSFWRFQVRFLNDPCDEGYRRRHSIHAQLAHFRQQYWLVKEREKGAQP